MSAICGFINLKGESIPDENIHAMMSKFEKYPAEYSNIYRKSSMFLGCRFKEITPESKYEKLPYRDGATGLTITADAIIDNRHELLIEFDIPSSEWAETTDSWLILMAYKKWGDECVAHLIGDFAFSIYNEHKNELFCARDHIGKRTFYFYNVSDTFIFSTTIEPLFCSGHVKKALNERWIANYLSFPGPVHEVDCNITVYENIFQLPPATYMKVDSEGIRKFQYWSPLNRPELKFKTDAEYEEGFREVFFEAVRCRLRSNGQVGITLSGGLDSGSVACVAAQELEKYDKNLYSYCFTPFSGYNNYLPKSLIADESEYVEVICDKQKNIKNTYVQFNDKSPISNINDLILKLEQPYKAIENFYWENEIVSLAAKNNCSILLNGALGNTTISYGYFYAHIFTLYRQLKFYDVLKEVRGFAKLYDISNRKILKDIFKRGMPKHMLNMYNFIKGDLKRKELEVPVNPRLANKYKTMENLFKLGVTNHNAKRDIFQMRELLSRPECFSQIGMYDTKLSLEHGLLIRDPTGDKRVFDYCFSLPTDQFVRNGMERSLIRRSMSGILPDKVRLNCKVRGYQSADWVQRIKPSWNSIESEIRDIIPNNTFTNYIDAKHVERALMAIGDTPDNRSSADVRMLIVCMILSRFIDKVSDVS